MVQNCPRCGTPNAAGHRYCSNCGAQVIESVKPTASEATQPAPTPHATGSAPAVMPEGAGVDAPRPGPVSAPGRPMTTSVRAELPPNAGERAGQATYVPYTSDATVQLEKQKPGNSWLTPTIGIAAAILVLLVGATVYLLLANRPSGRAALVFPHQVALPCKLPNGATAEEEIVFTVCHSSEEQIKAWRDLDTEVLKGSRTGRDLELNILEVEQMRTGNEAKDPILHKLTIVAVKSDETTASVQTSEVWSVTTYRKADKSIVDQKKGVTYAETYQLVKQGGKWFIEKVEFNGTFAPGDS